MSAKPLKAIQVRTERNGAEERVRCACGYEDKAYPGDGEALARLHNERKHGNRYRVQHCEAAT